jgi:AraC-like DNA-binding protein
MQLECKYNSFGIFNEQFKIGPAKWNYFDLLFVHDGHIVIWPTKKSRLELKTGQSVLIYPQTEFDGYSIADCTRVSVQHFAIIDGECLPKEISKLMDKENGCQSFLNIPGRLVERDIERLVGIRQSGNLRLLEMEMMSAVMVLVLLNIIGAQRELPACCHDDFEELLTLMEKNTDRNISLEEMAEVCGLSVSHFRATFKKHFFQSPGIFFRNMRMNAVAKKLRETSIPIKEISRQGGFEMLPNFYRAFRAVYGVSPAEYRHKNIIKG